MRRTYRSKKDTGGVIERRDLLLNLDEKSSAYNAFFIQNIKQTKRELSCVGSSNAHGVASNRVRKRKYVKRIVKEVETPFRISLSRSAYLTPDKSIHVNKPMDPFDMLLNSSPACTVDIPEPKTESVTIKVDAFDKRFQKKEGRTYVRKKPVKAKKMYYSSSDSSDSDKENSGEHTNVTQNTSDIKAYKLLIENDNNKTPKRIDDSINNIVNNISLLNKLKQKNSFNDSMKRSFNYKKHRLTRNIQSPMLLKSPLCSTPFKAKYRGESIYNNFSPISDAKDDNSPKYTTIIEDNDNSNNSIVFLVKNKSNSPKDTNENCNTSPLNVVPNAIIECDLVEEDPIDVTSNKQEIHPAENSIDEVESIKLVSNEKTSIEISSLQITEAEPFLGFSNNAVNEDIEENDNSFGFSHIDDELPRTNLPEIEVTTRTSNISDRKTRQSSIIPTSVSKYTENDSRIGFSHIDDELPTSNIPEMELSENCQSIDENDLSCGNDINDDDNSSLDSISNDKDSLYDTCTSEQSSSEEREVLKEPIVKMERMNDSLFLRYYEKIKFGSESDESDDSKNITYTKHDKTYDKNSLEDEETDEDSSAKDRQTDEDSYSLKDEDLSQEEEFASFDKTHTSTDKTDDNSSDIEMDQDNNLLENEASDYVSSNDEDSTEEEKCISFVTTRRRNEVTNNSMLSIFNNSYASSSTDCDKTVVSNNRLLDSSDRWEGSQEVMKENNLLGEISDSSKITHLSQDVDHPRSSTKDNVDTRISFVTTRNSNISDRKSTRKSRQSSIIPTSIPNNTTTISKSSVLPRQSEICSPESSKKLGFDKPVIVLQPGKKWERSLSIYRRMTMMTDHFDQSILDDEPIEKKGRKYRQSVICTMEMQDLNGSLHNESINSRRSTFVSKPSRSTIRIVKDPDISRLSLCNTTVFDDLKGFLNEECDDTIIELSKLSIADQTHEVTVLDTFHDTSSRLATARDYVLRRCSQTDAILFDECYPDTVLKNCHKIGEGVYGEVFLWRDRDGRARVLKIVPIAGTLKVNGESQKDFHEIISEIVIAMELSALRAPIAEINRHFDDGKDVEALSLHAIENATDIFNEVLAVRCVYGSYPARLLDLWDLYDECKGSENDNPAILPVDQQFIVLELANAGQDLESYQFNSAEQAYALFLQVAYGLAVAEEAFQFEHRDLHWGNVLIAPTDQKYATFVVRGRSHRVSRCGVAGTIIDYSLSRVSLPLAGGECAALYNDLARDDSLFDAVGDYQFEVYRLMREKLGNDWKNFAPYTNILWLHYTVDKMITSLRYKRTNTKIHKHYIDKLKGIKSRILDYGSAALFVLTDNEI